MDTNDLIAARTRTEYGVDKLRAENERLRAALRDIILREDSLSIHTRNEYEMGYKHGTEQCALIARDATGDAEQTRDGK